MTNAKPDKEFEKVLLAPGEGLEYNLAFAPSKNFQYVPCRALLLQLELEIFDGVNGTEVTSLCDDPVKFLLMMHRGFPITKI